MNSIGVDVGGTKILVCRVEDGKIVASETRPTPQDPKDTAEAIADAVCAVWSDDVVGVGVGLPGYIHEGILHQAPNLPLFEGEPIEELIRRACGVDVVCENDANCFAVAEHTLGAGREFNHMIGVILGTGVGAGIILNGKLYTGAIGGAGEVGDIHLLEGTWEDNVSGPGIMRAYQRFGGGNATHPGEVWTSNEESAHKTREHVLDLLGRFLASLINVFNPECIVLGGSVAKIPFYDELRAHVKKYCSEVAFSSCKIVQHEISAEAGVIGAAMLVK